LLNKDEILEKTNCLYKIVNRTAKVLIHKSNLNSLNVVPTSWFNFFIHFFLEQFLYSLHIGPSKKENWYTTRLTSSFFLFATLYILNDVYKKEQAHHMRIISLVAIGREGNDEINMNN